VSPSGRSEQLYLSDARDAIDRVLSYTAGGREPQRDSNDGEHPGSSGICADRAAAPWVKAELPARTNLG